VRNDRAYRNLWAAVLAQAIEDVHGNDPRAPHAGLEARSWFISADPRAGGFLFVCLVLDLAPDRTRRLALDPGAGDRLKFVSRLRAPDPSEVAELD
jgi:hypothetical protein